MPRLTSRQYPSLGLARPRMAVSSLWPRECHVALEEHLALLASHDCFTLRESRSPASQSFNTFLFAACARGTQDLRIQASLLRSILTSRPLGGRQYQLRLVSQITCPLRSSASGQLHSIVELSPVMQKGSHNVYRNISPLSSEVCQLHHRGNLSVLGFFDSSRASFLCDLISVRIPAVF
ncbi:hypothetical protein CC78DRAFT_377474 [Lojkania enalia]|uniref:Uncharacterized protein n=1 Tax=Lojkania enalia TaxID=147567 RepID=A0A9P4KG81_9PLEO|nr:hypothetical protein CC78DRAFT_377474 [Didymosphaeria enalia]